MGRNVGLNFFSKLLFLNKSRAAYGRYASVNPATCEAKAGRSRSDSVKIK
jgi:hypothetical protein